MAATTLLGGAFLSSFVNVLFERLSSPQVINWIRGKKLNQNLIQKLETTLYVLQAVINDAEKKQITDPAVKNWLANLEDSIYVTDDLLDEISTKAATRKDNQGTFLSRYFNLQDRGMVTRIEEVIDMLEAIAKHKDILGLKKIADDDNNMSWRIPSTSLVERSYVYGRDEDKDAIVKLLLDDACDGKISVIPIVGMGGIGKTTLAQLVYNDEKLKESFDCKAWVCVSEQFDVFKVTKIVIEAITCRSCEKNDLNLLQNDLKERLSGMKFLVVLDDLWNGHFNDWNVLQKPFQYGNKGSKILVTTRSDKVASVVQNIPPYKLSLLSDEHCWCVFLKHSFLSAESRDYAILEQVGRKIVQKCKGLPLAVEALGGLLRTKCDVQDWNDVLKSEIWEYSEESRIIPALRISYHYLPSHLKRCFVYCSLYPKDHLYDKDELVLLWMAQDLLQPKGRKTLEEIGYACINELVVRSFFQPFEASDRYFTIHDLVHDLATLCAGEFYFRAEELGSATEIGAKTRHLSHNATSNYPFSKLLAFDKIKHVRTILEINSKGTHLNMENATCLLSQLKYIRVLLFNSFPLVSLPDSIGELIHLRYLNLSQTLIATLSESLCSLYNLQTLKLNDCYSLKMLPNRMQDLVNLRHLDIRRTNLAEMPKGMSKLKQLQHLSDYIVGKHEENRIKELGTLADLHGSLGVHKLENVTNSFEASEARMVEKKYIHELRLTWRSHEHIVDSQVEREILDKLQPHPDLKELTISGYRGTIFPDWLGHSSQHTMTEVYLSGCQHCCMLPSFGTLPSLKCLMISDFEELKIIGAEFYKNDESCFETPFPSLETLVFSEMSCWQEWISLEFDIAFPKLKELTINFCPMLKGDLPKKLPDLEKLTIVNSEKLNYHLPFSNHVYVWSMN